MSTGVELIAQERARQMAVEGWTPEHDDEHDKGELPSAAACYALHAAGINDAPAKWPWDWSWWKPRDPIRDLVRAGALIAAELDRIIRAEQKAKRTKTRNSQGNDR